ncbi:MAG: hypothetical protein MJE77_27360 [Proteobacteria bacterium]|nr:hypothetical protein [Pseudomonadota bacterium]
METNLNGFLKLNVFPSGRRLFAQRQVAKVALGLEFTQLVEHLAEAIAHDQRTRTLEKIWAGHNARRGIDVRGVDIRLDQTLNALRDGAMAQAKGAHQSDPVVAQVDGFIAQLFPAGVHAITSLPYLDELATVEVIVARLQGRLAPVVVDLGLERPTRRLAALTEEYRAALEAGDTHDFDTVCAARTRGQTYLLETVALIVGRFYRNDDPVHAARRDVLLRPIVEQNNAIRDYLNARRTIRDIDPETGQLEYDDADSEAGPVQSGPDATVPSIPGAISAA